MQRDKFDKSIDTELLANNFKYYNDWEYGPISGWTTGYERYSLKLMKHDFGYWLIISCHAGGENPSMNIGSSNNAQDIIAIRDSLSVLW